MSHSSINAASVAARQVDGTPTWRPSALISEISSAAPTWPCAYASSAELS
jgi:hypothetical protein